MIKITIDNHIFSVFPNKDPDKSYITFDAEGERLHSLAYYFYEIENERSVLPGLNKYPFKAALDKYKKLAVFV